jgi:hypothetical protein
MFSIILLEELKLELTVTFENYSDNLKLLSNLIKFYFI